MCVILNGKEKIIAAARRNFVANMKKPAFVATTLFEATGVNRPPCFCCRQQIQKTCSLSVGEPGCTSFILYSESPEKVERKLFDEIAEVYKQKSQHRRLAA